MFFANTWPSLQTVGMASGLVGRDAPFARPASLGGRRSGRGCRCVGLFLGSGCPSCRNECGPSSFPFIACILMSSFCPPHPHVPTGSQLLPLTAAGGGGDSMRLCSCHTHTHTIRKEPPDPEQIPCSLWAPHARLPESLQMLNRISDSQNCPPRGFPGGPVVKIKCFHNARGYRFEPW